jgi:hypothetical protein
MAHQPERRSLLEQLTALLDALARLLDRLRLW